MRDEYGRSTHAAHTFTPNARASERSLGGDRRQWHHQDAGLDDVGSGDALDRKLVLEFYESHVKPTVLNLTPPMSVRPVISRR